MTSWSPPHPISCSLTAAQAGSLAGEAPLVGSRSCPWSRRPERTARGTRRGRGAPRHERGGLRRRSRRRGLPPPIQAFTHLMTALVAEGAVSSAEFALVG